MPIWPSSSSSDVGRKTKPLLVGLHSRSSLRIFLWPNLASFNFVSKQMLHPKDLTTENRWTFASLSNESIGFEGRNRPEKLTRWGRNRVFLRNHDDHHHHLSRVRFESSGRNGFRQLSDIYNKPISARLTFCVLFTSLQTSSHSHIPQSIIPTTVGIVTTDATHEFAAGYLKVFFPISLFPLRADFLPFRGMFRSSSIFCLGICRVPPTGETQRGLKHRC